MEDLLIVVLFHSGGQKFDTDRNSRFDFFTVLILEGNVHGLNALDFALHGFADGVDDFFNIHGLHLHGGACRECACRGVYKNVDAVVGLTDEGHRFGCFRFSRSRFFSRFFCCSSFRRLVRLVVSFCRFVPLSVSDFVAATSPGGRGKGLIRSRCCFNFPGLRACYQVHTWLIPGCPDSTSTLGLCGQGFVIVILIKEVHIQAVGSAFEGVAGNGDIHIALGLDLFTLSVQELQGYRSGAVQDFVLQVRLHGFGIACQFLLIEVRDFHTRAFRQHADVRIHRYGDAAVRGLLQLHRRGGLAFASFERKCCRGHVCDDHAHGQQVNQ